MLLCLANYLGLIYDGKVHLGISKIQCHVACKLQCDNPRSVGRCIKLLESLLDKANIVEMVFELEQNFSIPLSEDDMVLYENLDSIITQCMFKAE